MIFLALDLSKQDKEGCSTKHEQETLLKHVPTFDLLPTSKIEMSPAVNNSDAVVRDP